MTNRSPWFYKESIPSVGESCLLDAASSKQLTKVLRLRTGQFVFLTNGSGRLATALIELTDQTQSKVRISDVVFSPKPATGLTLGVSFLKNIHRWEWMLEKCTELGVVELIPLVCQRTQPYREKWNRWHDIVLSSMLQSQRTWKMNLRQATPFDSLSFGVYTNVYIAHCQDVNREKRIPIQTIFSEKKDTKNTLVLVGPEGDFSPEEMELSRQYHMHPISLGGARLRTETAAISIASMWH